MKKFAFALITVIMMTACGGGGSETVQPAEQTQPRKVNPRQAIWIPSEILFKKDANIAVNIKTECGLPDKFSSYIKLASDKVNVPVFRATKGADINKDRLVIEITEAVSSGNAFIGHRKYAKAVGTLYKNGKNMGSFTSARVTGGGMWGGFKGSCQVLERAMKVMASDIANWMTNPANGAILGDAM